MADTEHRSRHEPGHDVTIVDGGPIGCTAGVICARTGLDTVVFYRRNSANQECTHLKNYLGSPAAIDIEAFVEADTEA